MIEWPYFRVDGHNVLRVWQQGMIYQLGKKHPLISRHESIERFIIVSPLLLITYMSKRKKKASLIGILMARSASVFFFPNSDYKFQV